MMRAWFFAIALLTMSFRATAQSPDPIESLHQQARAAVTRGTPTDLVAAIDIWKRARALAREHDDVVRETALLNNIGVTQMRLEQPDAANASFREALDLARLAGNPSNELVSLYNLGRTAELLADTTDAVAQYRLALRLLERLPERTTIRIDIEHRLAALLAN